MKFKLHEAFDDDGLVSSEQEFSSAKTSINKNKLPAIFNMIHLPAGTLNIDYGGGKYDNATEYLATQDITSLVFDKFNRSNEHNKEVLKAARQNGGADSITCSNVLNVIKERDIRVNEVIKNIYYLLKSGGTAYFTVYQGNNTGTGGQTTAGYQLNKRTEEYIDEVAEIFGEQNVSRKGRLIVAKK